jgi:hypothetical protein
MGVEGFRVGQICKMRDDLAAFDVRIGQHLPIDFAPWNDIESVDGAPVRDVLGEGEGTQPLIRADLDDERSAWARWRATSLRKAMTCAC